MTFNRETKFGLTYGQVIASIALIFTMVGSYVSIKIDIQQLRSEQTAIIDRIVKMENIYIKISDVLTKPLTNEMRISLIEKENDDIKATIETMRKENREEHNQIMTKLDKLIKK